MTETIKRMNLDKRREIRHKYLLSRIERNDENNELFRDSNVRDIREWYFLTMYILRGKDVHEFIEKNFGGTSGKKREVPLKALETVGLTKDIYNIYKYLNVMK